MQGPARTATSSGGVSNRDHRRVRTVVCVLLALLTLVLVVTLLRGALSSLKQETVWRLVGAPNFGRVPKPESPPDGIDHVLQVAVGPPHANLDIWLIDPKSQPVGTVLVLHGRYDRKRTMVGFGKMLSNQVGLRSVLIDLRGHGHSSGDFLSFGQIDSQDLVQVMDALESGGLLVPPVSVYGPSYGGSVALQTAECDPRIEAVIAVATFASFETILTPYIDHLHPRLAWALPEAWSFRVLEGANRLAGIDLFSLDNLRAIRTTSARVLVMHGENDELVDVDQARALYQACGSERCRLVVFPGKNHGESMSGEVLNREATRWLKGHVQDSAAQTKNVSLLSGPLR